MALTKFGFIVTGDNFVQHQGTASFAMKVVGVKHASEGVEVAKQMVAEGIQLIELCGGFSPVWAGKIIEAIDYAVPVGVVAYGPESIDAMYRLFAS
jgi:2-keto-3-deoxy-6-phosphogluconate aldolase